MTDDEHLRWGFLHLGFGPFFLFHAWRGCLFFIRLDDILGSLGDVVLVDYEEERVKILQREREK